MKHKLLCASALTCLSIAFAHPAFAACGTVTANGQSVTCTGTDTSGLDASAYTDVTATVDDSAVINNTGHGGDAVAIGSGTVNIVQNAALTTNNVGVHITHAGGDSDITVYSNAHITAADFGILTDGGAGTTHNVTLNNATISGTNGAVVFHGGHGILTLNGPSTLTGLVAATNGGTGTLVLGNGGNSETFNTNIFATSYTGFNEFMVNQTSGSWVLTGTGIKDWTITSGSLRGTIANLGNIVVSDNTGSLVNFTGGGTVTSTISGAGAVAYSGASTYTLTAHNTYTGRTLLSGSNAIVSSSDAFGDDTGNTLSNNYVVMNNATLTYGASFNTARSFVLQAAEVIDTGIYDAQIGNVVGSGGLIKYGSGKLVVSGTTQVDGGIQHNEGTLELENVNSTGGLYVDSVSGPLTVFKALGTITGTSTLVRGSLFAGTTANPYGTLTLNGNYTADSDSSTYVNVNAAHQSSKLVVTGTADAGQSIVVNVDNSHAYSGNYAFRVFEANDITGTTSVIVSGTPTAAAGAGAYNVQANDFSFENHLDIYFLQQGYVDNQQFFSGITSVTMNNMVHNTGLILNRMTDLHSYDAAYNSAAMDPTQPFQVAYAGDNLSGMLDGKTEMNKRGAWMKLLGGTGDMHSDGGMPGYSSATGGFLAGIDRPVGEDALVGVSGGYTFSHLSGDSGSGSADVKSPLAAVYGSYKAGPVMLDSTLAYAHSDIDTDHSIVSGNASGSHNQNEYSAALQASHAYKEGKWSMVPRAGLQYTHLDSDAYQEHGGVGSSYVYKDGVDSLQPFIGTGFSTKLKSDSGAVYVPQLRVTYRYETLDTDRNTRFLSAGSQGLASGIAAAKNTLSLGGGMHTQLQDNLEGFANYDVDAYLGKGYEQTLSVGLKYTF